MRLRLCSQARFFQQQVPPHHHIINSVRLFITLSSHKGVCAAGVHYPRPNRVYPQTSIPCLILVSLLGSRRVPREGFIAESEVGDDPGSLMCCPALADLGSRSAFRIFPMKWRATGNTEEESLRRPAISGTQSAQDPCSKRCTCQEESRSSTAL